MKPRHLLLLLLFPATCLAQLTPYQQNVVKTFADAGTDKPLRDAYAAVAAGKGTPAHRNAIRNSEMIHEDLKLTACVRPALGEQSMDTLVTKIIAAGQGSALVADTKTLFDPAQVSSEIPANGTPEDKALSAIVMLASGSKIDAGTDPKAAARNLRRRVTLNYYLSFATDGKCKASVQLKNQLGKGSK